MICTIRDSGKSIFMRGRRECIAELAFRTKRQRGTDIVALFCMSATQPGEIQCIFRHILNSRTLLMTNR